MTAVIHRDRARAGLMLLPIYLGPWSPYRGRRTLGVARLPLSRPEVRLAKLVQSRRGLGGEPGLGGVNLPRLLPCDPALTPMDTAGAKI